MGKPTKTQIAEKNQLKISENDLMQFKVRAGMVESKELEVSLLKREMSYFIKEILEKIGCEKDKRFNISLDTGVVTEFKQPESKSVIETK